ncbi:C-signal [Latimeria chalumnae]|uniref:C-signal n=1 Tax=Latimeria chalumnae TaxID=7897 RepID=UPI00313ECCDE
MGILRCKSILITGASRGIGFELARQLASESPSVEKVIATCREPEKAKELQELTGKYTKLKIVQLDIVSKESIEKAVKEVEALVGSNGLNCLLNNAGEMIFANLETVTAEAMMRMYETNTVAHLMVSKAFLPLLKKAAQSGSGMGCHRAAIMNTSSITSCLSLVNDAEQKIFLQVYPYRISKTALNMVTRCIAADLKSENILCVAMNPGWVQTSMGGPQAPLTAKDSASGILSVLANLGEKDTGNFFDWKGEIVPW